MPEVSARAKCYQLHLQVVKYAIDSSDGEDLYFGDEAVGLLDEEEFHEKLYVERTNEHFEDDIYQQMVKSVPLVCIAGERGSGKTSAISRAQREMAVHHPDVEVLVIDIKRLYDHHKFDGLNEQNAEQRFGHVMRECLRAKLFPKVSDLRELVAWALAGPPDESDKFGDVLSVDLQAEYASAVVKAKCEAGSREEIRKALEQWFVDNGDEYLELQAAAIVKLRIAHIAQCRVSVYNKKKTVIVYDNIDRIPARLQSHFMTVCADEQLRAGAASTSIVSIRAENIRGEKPRGNDFGYAVEVLMPDDQRYPALLLPRLRKSHMERVLARRNEYAEEHIPSIEDASEGGVDGEIDDDALEQPGREYQAINEIHRYVVKEFKANAVNALSNDSIRTMLAIYSAFLRYLWTIEERGVVNVRDLPERQEEGQLATLFYLWLRDQGEGYGVSIPNLLIKKRMFGGSAQFKDLTSVKHLMLTCVHNLTVDLSQENGKRTYPIWAEVVSRLKELGFTYGDIYAAVKWFQQKDEDIPGAVEFCRGEYEIEDIREDSDSRLRLTLMGEELVTGVMHKVGYVWGVAFGENIVGALRKTLGKRKSFFEYSIADRARHVYSTCKRMSIVHLKLVSLLYGTWHSEYGEDWLDEYSARFGVGGELQLQRILSSSAAYFRNLYGGNENPFEHLLACYNRLLKYVSEGVVYDQLVLKELDESDGLQK